MLFKFIIFCCFGNKLIIGFGVWGLNLVLWVVFNLVMLCVYFIIVYCIFRYNFKKGILFSLVYWIVVIFLLIFFILKLFGIIMLLVFFR